MSGLTSKEKALGRYDEKPELWFTEAAVEQILAAREAAAWEAGYVQSSLAHGHIPPEADLSKYGAPNRGPHANPYRAELLRQGGEE